MGLFLSFLFSKVFVTKVLTLCPPPSSHQVLSSVPAQLQTGVRNGRFLKGEACPPGQEAEWTLALGQGGGALQRQAGRGPMPQDVQAATGCGAHSTVPGISPVTEGNEIIFSG